MNVGEEEVGYLDCRMYKTIIYSICGCVWCIYC